MTDLWVNELIKRQVRKRSPQRNREWAIGEDEMKKIKIVWVMEVEWGYQGRWTGKDLKLQWSK